MQKMTSINEKPTTSLKENILQSKFSNKECIRDTSLNQNSSPPLPSSPPPPSPKLSQSLRPDIETALCEHFQDANKICCKATNFMTIFNYNDTIDSEQKKSKNNLSIQNFNSNHIKFERKSSSRNDLNTPVDYFVKMPWHVMYKIFNTLDLQNRVRASMVNKRWHTILTNGQFPLEDVVVLNIFEQYVWTEVLSNNSLNRFQCVSLSNLDQFEKILLHCRVSISVKIWYITTAFARQILEKMKICKMKMRCLDIYPYSEHIGIENFYEFLPNVKGITMRPHGLQHFFKGLDLSHFPHFHQLDTLNLDCINLGKDAILPETLTTFEWQSRNDSEFLKFLPKIERLKNLQFFLLGHVDFKFADFKKFISLINFTNMQNLQYLIFKFVKFENFNYSQSFYKNEFQSCNLETQLCMLQFLKLDLCYCDLSNIISLFLRLTGLKLQIVSLNVLSDDENYQNITQLFNEISRAFYQRDIAMHLGLLQRDASTKLNIKSNKTSISKYFCQVLGKFEASFVSDLLLLQNIFDDKNFSCFPLLTEIKFIQCDALTDELLKTIATNCINLRKLCILNCTKCGEAGVRHFVELFSQRNSAFFKIVWKRDRNRFLRPSNFFLTLINEYKHLLTGLKYRFMCKVFNENNNGEAIIIWNTKKRLLIQDYDDIDANRILGIVVPGSQSPIQV